MGGHPAARGAVGRIGAGGTRDVRAAGRGVGGQHETVVLGEKRVQQRDVRGRVIPVGGVRVLVAAVPGALAERYGRSARWPVSSEDP